MSQKILIGENCTLNYIDTDYTVIREYLNMDIKELNDLHMNDNFDKFRTDEKLHKIVIDNNFIIGKSNWSDEEDYKVKIIEIPDNIEWDIRQPECEISEYICEKHRIWS